MVGEFQAAQLRVDRSARSSADVNLEFHTRARSRYRSALSLMKELRREHPTVEDLREYFLEHCPWMAPNHPTADFQFHDVNEAYAPIRGYELAHKDWRGKSGMR